MFNRIMEYDGRGEYVKLIHDDPTLFEMGLFSYMTQLEEVDERARVFIYKYEGNVAITAYRVIRDLYITVNKSDMSDSFSRYTLINGDVEESYESLFDIDIPCKKTVLLTKNGDELVLKII